MRVLLFFRSLFTVVTLTIFLLAACGRSPLVRPETSVSQTEIAAETGEAISPVVPATKPSEIPTSTPLPTATVQTSLVSEGDASPSSEPALTTPTAKPLTPLNERLDTLVFTTVGKQEPEIWRMQVDEQGKKAEPAERVDFPADFRTSIQGLYPSPNGQQVAIWELYGDGGTFIHILNVKNGKLTPLFGEHPDVDPRATFLDWTPDGQHILVQGGTGNPNLGNGVWLVDINTHTYNKIDIKQADETSSITIASFSSNDDIVYAQTSCYQCGSEIWRVSLKSSEKELLFKDSENRIEDVIWSPNGDYIAFNAWLESDQAGLGELYIIKPDGSDKRLISAILTGYYDIFKPVWSPDGLQIAFVTSEVSASTQSSKQLYGNLCVANVMTNQVHRLTHFQNTQVIKPTWSPDSSQIAFLISEDSSKFTLLKMTIDEDELQQLGDIEEVESNNLDRQLGEFNQQSSIVWLP